MWTMNHVRREQKQSKRQKKQLREILAMRMMVLELLPDYALCPVSKTETSGKLFFPELVKPALELVRVCSCHQGWAA